MKKVVLFLFGWMTMMSCSDQMLIEDVVEVNTEQTAAREFEALIEKARWGDGEAYLKLADCYREGNGVKKDFVKVLGMVSFANDFGAVNVVNQYMDSLLDDSEFRFVFDAMCKIDEKQMDEARDIADRLIANGSPDGMVMRGIIALEQGDSIDANRYFASAGLAIVRNRRGSNHSDFCCGFSLCARRYCL